MEERQIYPLPVWAVQRAALNFLSLTVARLALRGSGFRVFLADCDACGWWPLRPSCLKSASLFPQGASAQWLDVTPIR